MASFMHKVKDMVSSDKDHEASTSDTQTQSVDNQNYQQSSTDSTDSGNNYSNTTSYTAPENDSRFATAGQNGHGTVGSSLGYSSRNTAVDSSAYNTGGRGTTQQTTQGYSDDSSFNNSKNPRDAAHVPPSVLTDHVRTPDVPYGETTTDHGRRHSLNTGESLQKYGSGTA